MSKDGKLLYHLTALANLESIFQNGLQSRAALATGDFEDVADGEIINSRQQHNLDQNVPFHFFAKSPFEYGVQRAHPDQDFVLVTVRRAVAQANNWQIVPRHPLAEEGYQMLNYDEGVEAIDWALIEQRNYEDRACKVACMAECLSPDAVSADKIFSIYVKTREVENEVRTLAHKYRIGCYINLRAHMFAGDVNDV